MATNASKFTGVQNGILTSDMSIDAEQIKADAQAIMQAGPAERSGALTRFMQNNHAAVHKAVNYAKNHPWMARAMIGAGTVAVLVPNVAADTAFGMNSTEMDAAFDVLNNHLLPNVGGTISAMPAIIIPLVMLVVLIMVMLFVPELLTSMIDMIKDAMKLGTRKRS